MKTTLKIRSLLQLLAFLSVLMFFGAAGAWENGSINFLQFLLESAILLGASCFFARMSKRRILSRMIPYVSRAHRTETRPAAHSKRHPIHAA